MKAIGKVPWLVIALAIGCIAGLLVNLVLPTNWFELISGGGTVSNRATVILERIQALSQLTTTRYNYSVIVTSTREMPALLQGLYGESLSLVAVGYVNAGVDLSQLTVEDVVEQNGIVVIRLPPPVVQECFLDEQASYVVRRDTGIFANPSPNLDTEARRYAVTQLRDAALQSGILENAQVQASTVITELATAFGVEQVQVLTTPPDPAVSLPATCG